jgi:hypothetical protein
VLICTSFGLSAHGFDHMRVNLPVIAGGIAALCGIWAIASRSRWLAAAALTA